jgi:hypothetical protein
MKILPRVASVLLAAAALLATWSAGLGARSLYSAATEARVRAGGVAVEVPLAGIPALRLGPDGVAEPVDLGTIRDGVILAFDASCGVCNQNMWNWVDVIHAATDGGSRPAERVHALAIMAPPEAWAYWMGLTDHVQVLVTDTATVAHRLNIPGPPATLVVENGIVRHRFDGLLDSRAKAVVTAAARGW